MQIFGRYQCQYGYLANNGERLVLEAEKKGESVLSVVYYLVLTFYLLEFLRIKFK